MKQLTLFPAEEMKFTPKIDKTIGEAQEIFNKYGLGITIHTKETHRLVDVIIHLENRVKALELENVRIR